MKIYLRSSIQEKSAIGKIESAIKNVGHKVESSTSDTNNNDYSSSETSAISKCDVFMVEASTPTAQLGFELAFATEKGIPTVILYRDDAGMPLVAVNSKTKPVIRSYKVNEIEKDIKNILEEISNKIDNQFTFNLTPQISEFLNWITSNNKINRADYIRGLIDNARQKSTEYKNFKKG